MKGFLYQYLGRYGDPAPNDVVSSVERVWESLKPEIAEKRGPIKIPLQTKRDWRLPLAPMAAAALVILISVFLVRHWKSAVENSPSHQPDLALSPQKEPFAAFEVVSIRRSAPLTGGGNRGGADTAGPLPPCVNSPRLFPQRFNLPRGTIYHLIALAYGQTCPPDVDLGLIAGGPEWIRSDRFDIQAIMPEGSPVYTQSDLTRGNAPKLQIMIQTVLADRFKLALHRETQERPIYNLAVAKPGKMRLSEDQTPPAAPGPRSGGPRGGAPPRGVMLVQPKTSDSNLWSVSASAIPISRLVDFLQGSVERVIVDKTRLKGLFDIRLEIAANLGPGAPPDAQKEFNSEILQQLGLKLESARGPVEVLVIDHIEQPSEN